MASPVPTRPPTRRLQQSLEAKLEEMRRRSPKDWEALHVFVDHVLQRLDDADRAAAGDGQVRTNRTG